MAEELIKLGGYVVQGHGSDETVLWEGTFSSTSLPVSITLSESVKNFEKIEITMGGGYKSKFTFDGTSNTWQVFSPYVGSSQVSVYAINFSVNNNTVTCDSGRSIFFNVKSTGITDFNPNRNLSVGENQITKIVGIGRKPVEG